MILFKKLITIPRANGLLLLLYYKEALIFSTVLSLSYWTKVHRFQESPSYHITKVVQEFLQYSIHQI